jgi:predicted extracellular nuclease
MSRREILGQEQYMNLFCPAPLYKKVTADPQPAEPEPIGWERPILHVRIGLEGGKTLHILNVHLKSKAPTDIVGQNKDVPDPKPPPFAWRTAFGWAEGFFVSSMKRVGQALEARIIVDDLFNQDASALIVVCGDFNADSDDVPVQAIRGDVENTGNPALSQRILVPCEQSIPESARYSYLYHGKGEMIDHLLVSRILLEFYGGSEIHNELLHDESASFAVDKKYPESDHAPVVAHFDLP